MNTLLIFNFLFIFAAFLIFINFIVNSILFKDISIYSKKKIIAGKEALISVLVPARNEAENIEACILSLVKQDYRNIEILVLDDNSTDATYRLVKKMAKEDNRIKLFSGRPLETRWVGKNFALFQL